ncbi:N-6 DNA methylase [Nocardia jiangsuensis]|uniref:N-6 DNA methylase n=1 Tax=Nocardia jiangsuensis TaxID=1691563 RepID=A0ABV8DKU2_9NOCA
MTRLPAAMATPSVTPAGSVPKGKRADFLTGNLVSDTPEEYVRQNIEKALVRQYKYPAADCEPEFPIKVGSSKKRIDIAVFTAGNAHTQANVRVIIETKRPETKATSRTEGIGQLHSYMAACLNAEYGMWTNGDDRYCFAKRPSSSGGWVFEEIIEIPAHAQSEEDAQRPSRKSLVVATADNLLFAFRRCHNYIAAHEGKQKTEAFWELLKIIFTKIEDERSPKINFYATPSERANTALASSAKKRIQSLFKDKVVRKYPGIFEPRDEIIDLSPAVVAYVVTQLQNFSLLLSPVDVKGVAYEEIVGSNLRGDRGEFFTPRNACRMAVEMLDPQPMERVLDPSCGTGGFLITAMNHALAAIERDQRNQWLDPSNGSDLERQELYRRRTDYLSQCVFGIDLNPALVRAAKMNMVMNNDGSGGLWQANTLLNPHAWNPDLRQRIPLASVDVIVSNPPFGANIPVDDEEVLAQYELAAVWDEGPDGEFSIRRDRFNVPVMQRSQPPEILFVERCLQLLRPGTGRMAMVIPNGILNNPGLTYVRRWILSRAQVLAVVDMNRELFQPKNDTQTSMVLLRRLSAEEETVAAKEGLDYPVFMAIAEKIGHDKRGNTIFRRTPEGEEVLVLRTEQLQQIDQESGGEVFETVTVTEKQVDDDLPDVADAYRDWLASQA